MTGMRFWNGAEEAYRSMPSPPRLFPPGVRKYHSVMESNADREQRLIDWFLSRE
jgi:hypothetical protein